ncbi:MAG: hypothetical protein KDD62_00970 [Bdellovibrionales bacterium]|nr:hypothetical protein [Bdellovibrionales bacterium]
MNDITTLSAKVTIGENHISPIERSSAIVAATTCLGVLSYLLIRGKPFADPNLAIIARIFMSLTAAIFGATVSGFLQIRWSGTGMVLRAGGAFGLFALTFWGTPTIVADVLGPPDVKFQTPKVIDVRSFYGPTLAYEEMLQDSAVVIARMVYTNDAQPAKNAFLTHESVHVALGNFNYELEWQYIVNIFPRAGCWPCIEESVSTKTIPSGESIAHETLFSLYGGPTWEQFIKEFLATSENTVTFHLTATVDGEVKTAKCIVNDLAYWRTVVRQWQDENEERLPARLTLPCVQ